MKNESRDADLFFDESILSFFHIMESFKEIFINELKNSLNEKVKDFLFQYFELCHFSEVKIKEKVAENKKIISKLLTDSNLTLAVKLKHFLNNYDMLDDNVSSFIDAIIPIRNSIAHGRITHQDKFLWPLPPFFSIARNSYTQIDFLILLTAQMISKYIGITRWENKWKEIKKSLPPSKTVVNSFLNDEKICFENNKHNITWQTIFNYYIQKPKNETLDKIEKKLETLEKSL